MRKMFLGLLAVLSLGGCAVGSVKEPSFTVVQKEGDIEIRRYDPMIVAEVTMTGEREKAINDGFRVLADYIFGNNTSSKDIAMTAPVTQQASEKIAMTTPVTQQVTGQGAWKVHFVMPSEYTMATLPKPKNKDIKIMKISSYDSAVIRFSGFGNSEKMEDKTNELERWMKTKNIKGVSVPVYAFYNPPWTLPFLRRNEVMITISPKP
jgi:DNA gyrase inhibitor GyrI